MFRNILPDCQGGPRALELVFALFLLVAAAAPPAVLAVTAFAAPVGAATAQR